MAASLKVDVSIMPDFPTPPPHSDSSTASSSSATSPSSSSSSDKARSTVAESTSSSSCPYGPDYDQHGHKIKRPMNAFMVWAQMRRAEITAVSSKVHNSTISKALGVEWREMDEAAKQPYVQKAKELRDELFREHPHYVYRPRKRKSAGARPSPYSPPSSRASPPAANAAIQMPILPSHPLLMDPSVSTSPQPLAALLMQQQHDCSLQQLQQQTTTPQMSMLFPPGQLLQQLQLAAVMQQQQQDPTALINPLLLANLLNPLFTQMLTQLATTPAAPQ